MKAKFKLKGIKHTTPEIVKRIADSINGAIAGSGIIALGSGYPKFALGLGLAIGIVKAVSNFFTEDNGK